VAGRRAQDQHLEDGDRDAEAAMKGEHDALALVAENRLADEVEDGSLSGQEKFPVVFRFESAGIMLPTNGSE